MVTMPNNTEKIWLQFSDQLKSFISRQVSEKSVVDDILQDVFVKIHSRIDTLHDDLKIRGWIYQIARNTIIDHYRKKKIKSEDIDLIGNVDDDFDAGPAQKIADGLKEMVIDFENVKFFSSAVLGLLLDIRAKLKTYEGEVVISGINPQLYRVFKITNLDKIFRFFPDKQSAIRAAGIN